MPAIDLKPADMRRLEKLAAAAGRRPEAMLPFVLRDGFDYCERMVKATHQGQADIDKHGTVSAEAVASKARAVIARHGRQAA
ncbi:MAG: hypothetical protein L6Q60_00425 [Rhodocyclaceae bacterium]|nr:hypothetical protein [Rhodocyclaceae bacterium]